MRCANGLYKPTGFVIRAASIAVVITGSRSGLPAVRALKLIVTVFVLTKISPIDISAELRNQKQPEMHTINYLHAATPLADSMRQLWFR